ncbi:MAG: hypothetical protein LW863_07435 [Flammeovirgaceae bacterium]|nr:hypothetical protein [Flammeovirgaceae bacterium]
MPQKQVLEFIARLAYNIPGLSGELKLYFSQFLTAHFSKTLSKEQIEDIENRRASSVITEEEKNKVARSFSFEDKAWCIAALGRLQDQAEKVDDRILSRRIGKLIEELTALFGLSEQHGLIQKEKDQIEQEILAFQNRLVIKIETKIWPIALDYVIRFAFLLSFSFWDVKKDYLALLNILFIPIVTLVAVYIIGKVHKRANLKLLDTYGGAAMYKIEYSVSVSQYTWLAFFLSSSIFISYLLPDRLHILALFGLSFYYFLYLRYFRIGRLGENDLVRQLENKGLDTRKLTVDENDEVIVALETKLNSATSRLEAYVLESALFGALTFSGFLQIMATDLVSFKDLEDFASYIFSTAQAFIHLDGAQFDAGIIGLSNKKSLFCLVSAQSLICSIFFLAVISSRLRFSDIADKVRTALNLAKAYNTKEEVLHDEQEISGKTTKRLELLTAKVNEQLRQATLALEEISPVMQYMEYFRNAGILVFLIILISSSLFITSILGWTFLALTVATYLYFNRSKINTRIKSFFLSFRIAFIKQGYWLFAATILPQVLAFVLRLFFHVRDTNFLFAVSYFLMGLYVFAWLILAAHVDEQFGEIEVSKSEQTRLSRWKFFKNILAVLVLIGTIGLTLKHQHLQGANEMLILSLGLIGTSMFFIGYYLTKTKWIGIICGWVMSVSSVGALFKLLHFEGAEEMRLIGISCAMVMVPLIVWKRKTFHSLMIRFCVATILIGIYFLPIFEIPKLKLQIAYDHETFDTNEILGVFEKNSADSFLEHRDKALEEGITKSDWYIQQYGMRYGFTEVYRTLAVEYYDFASAALESVKTSNKNDTTLLPLALKAIKQEYKIIKLFNFKLLAFNLELEPDILMAMGRREEAIESLERIIPQLVYDDNKEYLKEKLKAIKEQNP